MTEGSYDYQYVRLDRTFRELPKSASESDDADLGTMYRVGKRLGWSDLRQEYRVIMLAEAGAGKTEEIRNAASDLRQRGLPAFFLRLENIPNDFEESFEVGSLEEFQAWLTSNDEGWLFLDSVDEARLRDPGDFALAVKKLAKRIATAKDRTHVTITGRINAWRPKTDLALCMSQFSLPPRTRHAQKPTPANSDDSLETAQTSDGGEDAMHGFKIVTLDDLSSVQIGIFAQARGVYDSKPFLDAVERADAWSFTARPQDLIELIEFWTDQRRIGSRLELMRNSIARRLEERDQQRADARPLAPTKALDGARMIAAATTLGPNTNIRVPDGAENATGIALQTILPDWDDRDRLTLLSRPIFDEAIYGTVRFHHRSVREYLVAEWFASLLDRGTSRRKIESLFFANQYGIDVVVPMLRPILPWLAILDAKVRERVRKIAPEIIFEGGDPSQLPLDMRKVVLHEVCEQLASGSSGRSMTDYAAVQRFANADLTEEIRGLFCDYTDNEDIIGFLLRMVWLGQIAGALPEAKQVALSPKSRRYSRIAAFRAVQAVGSDADCRDVRQHFSGEAAVLDRQWLAELVKEAPATAVEDEWLLECLAKVKGPKAHSVDELPDAVTLFVQKHEIGLIPRLIEGFEALLQQPPVIERRHCEVSEQFKWLMGPASIAVEQLLQAREQAALGSHSLAILNKITAASGYLGSDIELDKTIFAKLVRSWPKLNKALFWHEVGAARRQLDKKKGERLTDYWHVFYLGPLWQFNEDDFEYMSSQIRERPFLDDQLVALTLAFHLYATNGRARGWRVKLKKICTNSDELTDRLNALLKPKANKQVTGWRRQEAGFKRRSAARKKEIEKNREDWRKFIREHVASLRDNGFGPGEFTRAQHYLHEQMREDNFKSGRWTEGNWQSLIKEHGDEVARAFRDGMVAFWRGYSPVLRSEGAPDNSTPMQVVFGLTGLEIESRETPDWVTMLSDADAVLACRYASLELNGFPTWFPRLFEVHSEAVGNFLLGEIEYELTACKADQV